MEDMKRSLRSLNIYEYVMIIVMIVIAAQAVVTAFTNPEAIKKLSIFQNVLVALLVGIVGICAHYVLARMHGTAEWLDAFTLTKRIIYLVVALMGLHNWHMLNKERNALNV